MEHAPLLSRSSCNFLLMTGYLRWARNDPRWARSDPVFHLSSQRPCRHGLSQSTPSQPPILTARAVISQVRKSLGAPTNPVTCTREIRCRLPRCAGLSSSAGGRRLRLLNHGPPGIPRDGIVVRASRRKSIRQWNDGVPRSMCVARHWRKRRPTPRLSDGNSAAENRDLYGATEIMHIHA